MYAYVNNRHTLKMEDIYRENQFPILRVKIIYIYIYASRLNSTIEFTRKANTHVISIYTNFANFSSEEDC